jgi:BirA family transcriptional regulator, biotin operon repressor / biotin---[acetyl-CoA-carboxylase] ligase
MLPHILNALHEVERFYSQAVAGSTNDLARAAIEFPSKGIFVFQTDYQTAGRGRRGTPWFSDSKGGLAATILSPLPSPEEHFAHNRALSCGICEAIESITGKAVSCSIKWPNDIYLNDKKVCGILLESHPVRNDMLVLGFGINVNSALAAFPMDLQPLATSLAIETGKHFPLSRLLVLVIGNYLSNRGIDRAIMHHNYEARLYGLGRRITLDGATGIFDAVEADGRLRMNTGHEVIYKITGHLQFID